MTCRARIGEMTALGPRIKARGDYRRQEGTLGEYLYRWPKGTTCWVTLAPGSALLKPLLVWSGSIASDSKYRRSGILDLPGFALIG